MTEPEDSFTNLQAVADAYKAGTSTADDVRQAIVNAVGNGNDQMAVATFINQEASPPADQGQVWFDPNPDQLWPPAQDVTIDLSDNEGA